MHLKACNSNYLNLIENCMFLYTNLSKQYEL
jgi:hypothetical protein